MRKRYLAVTLMMSDGVRVGEVWSCQAKNEMTAQVRMNSRRIRDMRRGSFGWLWRQNNRSMPLQRQMVTRPEKNSIQR